MRVNLFLRIICLVICFCLPCISHAQGEIVNHWWNNNMLIATGYGVARKGVDNPRYAQNLARRAAIMDGYRNLAELAKGIPITAKSTIGSEIQSGSIKQSKVDAVVKGAKILSENYDEYNNCVIVMCVPIYGVKNSVANVAFKPVEKKSFPRPTSGVAKGNYTGLIIGCGAEDLKPVLAPVIRNQNNQSIYSYNNLDYDKVISNGVVSYVTNGKVDNAAYLPTKTFAPLHYSERIKNKLLLVTNTAQNNLSRAGNNPLIINATAMSDDNSCPVISAQDSDRILAENQASHFLDNASVVFVSYRVGGVRA